MPKIVSRLGCALVVLTVMAAACGLVWVAGMVVFGDPQLIEEIGEPAPQLDPLQRSALSLYLRLRSDALDEPAGEPTATIEMEVSGGEPARSVVDRLVAAGVVEDAFLLRTYMRYRGLDLGVEAGHYQLNGGMTVREIAEALQTARPSGLTLTVLEGWRMEQIADALAQGEYPVSSQAFLQAAAHPTPQFLFLAELPQEASLEGFLFPDTYLLDPELRAEGLVEMMLDNFNQRVDMEMRDGFGRQGLSLYEAVTLASIVEREAVLPQEQPVIASVFLNRLSQGMPLEADPTVQYAVATRADSWWKSPLGAGDLAVDSLYNTYRFTGLPPGPIANPGLSALNAVAQPESTSYYYFRAACDGSGAHLFAETYEEHQQNACP